VSAVFGFSFSELLVVAVVALIVMGPKDLPKMLHRLGRLAGQVRRAAADLRANSGIDDALRSEGLADPIAEIRKLARGELDAVRQAATIHPGAFAVAAAETYGGGYTNDEVNVVRDREYPRGCADTYEALPDTAILYEDTSARGPLARDPLYVLGDASAELPPEPAAASPEAMTTLMGGIGVATITTEAVEEAPPTTKVSAEA
jgi:sec-independent protein translocase protein TatB